MKDKNVFTFFICTIFFFFFLSLKVTVLETAVFLRVVPHFICSPNSSHSCLGAGANTEVEGL